MKKTPPTQKVLHLISQAHLDPVWLWPVRDGMAEALTTMQSAVDRAAEIPSFRFSRSSAETYRWIKETDPVLFQKIKKLVRQGRWEIVGGWLEQADCNLPSTESFFRQALYGHDFFRREFDQTTRIGYNVDSFGHAGGLPQILKQSGFDRYVFMRPEPNDNSRLPLLFWWESADGSRVLTQRVPEGGYAQPYGTSARELEQRIRLAAERNFAPGFLNGIFWLGVGNHGGGPTRKHLAKIVALQNDPTLPELRFSTVRDYFDAVEQEPGFGRLPVLAEELGFCLRGCYSATGAVKRIHRAAEKGLYTAEALQVMAGETDPGLLREAWRRLLFNEFHDILAGSCVESTWSETRDRFGSTLDAAREIILRQTCRLARRVDTRSEKGSVLFVANPLPWPRRAIVQLDTFITPHGDEDVSHLETHSGKRIPIQWMNTDANYGPCGTPWGKLTAVIDLPAGGYTTLRVAMRPKQKRKRRLPIPATRKPALSTWVIPSAGELLRAPVGVVVIEDKSDTWGHHHTTFDTILGRPKIVSTHLLEDGSLVRVIRQRSRWKSSEIWMDVLYYRHTAQIGLRFRFNWQEPRQILKLEIPTRLIESRVICKTAGGVTLRRGDEGEVPCQDWVALEGSLGEKTVSVGLMNDSSYSYDVSHHTLRMVLARSAPYAEHTPYEYEDDSEVAFLDQGWQERRFWMIAQKGPWNKLGLERCSQEWQIPGTFILDSGHPGMAPWEMSGLSVTPSSVAMLSAKAAENGRGLIVRLQEMEGNSVSAVLTWKGLSTSIPLNPWEIATIRMELRRGRIVTEKTDALEHSLPLKGSGK